MQAITKRRAIAIGLRARFPLVARIIALAILISGVGFVAISYYRSRNNKPFRLRSEAPELSKEVTGVIDGYEQRMTRPDGSLLLLVKATRDTTFSDNHHEMENVDLAVYPPEGDTPDHIAANRAIYNPETSTISFVGNVKVQTKDGLKVNTESIVFDRKSEIAQTDAFLSFDRENVSGKATGAVLEAKNQKLELKKDVELIVAPAALESKQAHASARSKPVLIHSAHALFERAQLKLSFSGGVTAEQERDIMSGDNLFALLNQEKRLQKLEVRGNAYLRSMEEGRAAEVHAIDMDFFLDNDQRLERAVAMQDTRAQSLDADAQMMLTGASLLEVKFAAQADRSLLKEMRTEGRTVMMLAAPRSKAQDPRAANKRLTADLIKLSWRISGRDVEKAEAVGNAELFIEPVVRGATSDKKTLTAPRFDCEFYESGNLARNFTATGGAKIVIEPMQPNLNRGTRTMTSQKISAAFVKDTQDLERADAQGEAKFNEADRNGIAANVSYIAAENIVRLRGGEPTVWDSRARTKALELDSDLNNHVSYSRGKTATTYYSQEQTGGATPFTKVKSPVYITSERGEFHHDSEVAIYIGNARAWQDDNFVRADRLTIYIKDRRMEGSGRVQSAVYNVKRRNQGEGSLPVFASADSLLYSDPNNSLHYEGNVDIRQGSDRITSGVANVYLFKDSKEVEKTIAQRNVVLIQPNRKGTGDWVQYTTIDEVAVLKGNPARVEDVAQGSTEGGRLTLYIREGRVTADDARGPQSAGRVRSVHKVRKP
ncbi:MAG TPA: LPS export ABC transporter periplasmic protein LptC [Pyrinomonadaceae bacterium]|nr:LPS export ABC transporter periplasmic protein LptC [Pyrinomonadaceae bacterium]